MEEVRHVLQNYQRRGIELELGYQPEYFEEKSTAIITESTSIAGLREALAREASS